LQISNFFVERIDAGDRLDDGTLSGRAPVYQGSDAFLAARNLDRRDDAVSILQLEAGVKIRGGVIRFVHDDIR
jgi:hypothetical protein